MLTIFSRCPRNFRWLHGCCRCIFADDNHIYRKIGELSHTQYTVCIEESHITNLNDLKNDFIYHEKCYCIEKPCCTPGSDPSIIDGKNCMVTNGDVGFYQCLKWLNQQVVILILSENK